MQTKILYEDNDLFVIHKPAGIAVQSARVGQMDLESELKNYLAKKRQPPFIGLVHRLDQPVEGLLVVAKNKKAAAELNKQLTENALNKTYLAVVHLKGANEDLPQCEPVAPESCNCEKAVSESGNFTDYMIKDGQVAKIVPSILEGSKIAKLHYIIIRKQDNIALVKVEIETGRFHQIRCQMAHHNMPLLGDSKYGTEESINIGRNCGIRQVALCASELGFIHPITKKEMYFSVNPQNKAFAKFL